MTNLSLIASASFNKQTVSELTNILSEEQIFGLAERYDSLIIDSTAKKQGSFYTPLPLVQHIISRALEFHDTPPRSIADMACGSGIFLLQCVRQIRSNFNLPPLAALNSIYGVDRDGAALTAAQVLLASYAFQIGIAPDQALDIVSRHLGRGNALIGPEELEKLKQTKHQESLQPFSWHDYFPQVFSIQTGFDLIVGNPPYGLSRAERISAQETEILRTLYLNQHRGRINSYILFILRALELLAPQGTLSFVVPNAWLGIDEARSIRKLLIESGMLKNIDTFSVSPFKKLGVEVITFIIKKGCPTATLEIRTLRSIDNPIVITRVKIPRVEIAKDSSYRISLTSNERRMALVAKIEAAGNPLKNNRAEFKAAVGLQAYAKGRGHPPQTAQIVSEHSFHSTIRRSQDSLPYLEGKDLSPFGISWSGQYLEYGSWLAESPPISLYQTPRIAIREILGSFPRLFQAAVITEPYVYNRSILHIHPLSHPGIAKLTALAAILNSSVAGFWLWQRGRKAQRRLFPKIVVHDLNDFPIPPLTAASLVSLGGLYSDMAFAQQESDSGKILSLYRAIDNETATLYGIQLAEIEDEFN